MAKLVAGTELTFPAICKSRHFCETEPKSKVSFVFGIIWEFTSAAKVTESVAASPSVKSPSEVMLPFACRFPWTLTLPPIVTSFQILTQQQLPMNLYGYLLVWFFLVLVLFSPA